jgi:hypothetical protein
MLILILLCLLSLNVESINTLKKFTKNSLEEMPSNEVASYEMEVNKNKTVA